MNERELAKAIVALTQAIISLHAWLQANASAFTKRDAKEMEARLLLALGERIDPKAVADLTKESSALKKAVADNQPKLSGQ